jgi:serine phosphatase RsbU (regulator of sigma subunit)
VQLLERSPTATLAEVAAAAGVSRSTIYRHFPTKQALLGAVGDRAVTEPASYAEDPLPPGHLGRGRPVELEAIHVFDAVSPPLLPEQLVAEAQRIAKVPLGLYVVDIDGSNLLRVAGPERLPELIEAPLAVGPELDAASISELRGRIGDLPGAEVIPLWLRGRATGAFITLGRPEASLAELARQASAAITLADRYTDTFARAQRRKQPKAAAEMQQSLLPPRIMRTTGGEVAGHVLPSYEVAGDWFDVTENVDGVWITLADGLGGATRATASAAVALGALRAARRSGANLSESLLVMHTTLKEMPGPRAEMVAVATRWDPASQRVEIANCGHVAPVVIRRDRGGEPLETKEGRGLGGRGRPDPGEQTVKLTRGDRLVLVSDGVVTKGDGKAGLGMRGLIDACLESSDATAADTVRKIHMAVLKASGGELSNDATAVCLSVS